MKLPKDTLKMTAADWVAYGQARRRSMPQPRVHTTQPKASNKPHPSLLQSPAPMSDEYYRAMASVRRAEAERLADIENDPYWQEPYDA